MNNLTWIPNPVSLFCSDDAPLTFILVHSLISPSILPMQRPACHSQASPDAPPAGSPEGNPGLPSCLPPLPSELLFPTWQLPLDFKDPPQIKLILKWKEFELLACHSQLVPLCTVFFLMLIQIASKASKGMAVCLGPFSRVPHGISYMDFFSGNLRKKSWNRS